MAKGINIAIGADTRAYADAVKKGMIDPTEQAAEALQELGRDGGRDLGKLEDGMRDAQRATENTRDEVEDLKKQLRDVGDEAKKSVGDRTRKATDDAAKGFDELKDEGSGTAREVAASFDGSMESIQGGIQEVAANAFAGFGPAGAAAGLAAAAGIGFVTAALQEQDEKAAASAELVSEMYDKMLESGTTYLTSLDKVSFIDSVLGNEEDRKKAQEAADKIGVTLTDYLMAQFDIGGKREQVEKSIRDLYEEQAAQMERPGPGMEERALAAAAIRDREKEALTELLKYDSAQQEAAELSAVRNAAVKEVGATERAQIQRTRDADQARYEAAARSRDALAATPAIVPIQFREPNAAAVYNSLQRKLKGFGPVRVDAEVYTRNGTPVY